MTDIDTTEHAEADTLERRRPGRLTVADNELIPLMRRPAGPVSEDVRRMLEEDAVTSDFVAGPPASAEEAEEERNIILKVVMIICAICAFAMVM